MDLLRVLKYRKQVWFCWDFGGVSIDRNDSGKHNA